jgi:ribosomal subunit interface protein
MQIRVTGKNIEIGESLPEHVRIKLEAAVTKHFEGESEAHVIFSKEGADFRADCTVHLSSGTTMQAHAVGPDAYKACDQAVEHMEKRVRRYARRLKNHHDRGAVSDRSEFL